MIRRALVLGMSIAVVCVALPLAPSPTEALSAPVLAGRVHERFQPRKGKIFVAIIGSDARHGNSDIANADAIHIGGINTKTMRGGILNFPRDAWVNIPGSGEGRINEALLRGGPELVAKTLEALTGIQIDYWVMTGFDGFRGIVDHLGGVKMRVPQDIYDPYGSGANLEGGVQNLGAEEALAYVRTRHSFVHGDIDRTTNQGEFLLAMLRKLDRQTDDNSTALFRWMALAHRYTRLNISAGELFRLGVLASQVSPRDVGNVTVPASIGSVGAASVVFISPAASSIYKRFEKTGAL